MQAETEAVAEEQTEGLHLAGEADLFGLGPAGGDLVGRDARPYQRDRLVDPFARLLIGVLLRWRGAADIEGAVIAGAIAVIALDDIEESLIAGADQPVGEIMRMRVAALARDRVDRLDIVGAEIVEPLVGERRRSRSRGCRA